MIVFLKEITLRYITLSSTAPSLFLNVRIVSNRIELPKKTFFMHREKITLFLLEKMGGKITYFGLGKRGLIQE